MHLRFLTRTLTLLAIVAVPAYALAQTPPASPPAQQAPQSGGGVGIGVKGGPLFSSLTAAQTDVSNRTGFIGGLFIGGNRHGVVGVGVDILYARKGLKDTDGVTLDLDYINVPVYARINAGSSSLNKASVYGIIGVDLNFLLKAKFNVLDTDAKDDFTQADYGLAVGIGAEITRFVIEGRYTKGLGNIAKKTGAEELKTQSFAVMFGVRFN